MSKPMFIRFGALLMTLVLLLGLCPMTAFAEEAKTVSYSSAEFEEAYTYEGNDLGAV